MAQQYAYVLQHLSKRIGKIEILKDITLAFYPDAKIGVIGPNGAGKSSLLRIMAGVDREFDGVATPMPGITVGYVPQEPTLDPSLDVRGNVELGLAPVRDLLRRFEEVCDRLGADLTPEEMDRTLALQERLQGEIDAVEGWELERRLEIAMDAMRLPPGDAEVSRLSGGERRRVALCRTLLAKPQMLFLDEPTNHLDAESVAWLERALNEYPGCVLVVTHDRYFLENFCGWILEMESGRGIPWRGNYSMWIEQKKEELRVEQDQQRKRRRALERELEWVRASARGRQVKSKARLSAYDKMAEAEGTDAAPDIEILIPAGPRLGDLVLRAEKVSKGYDGNLLIEDLTFDLPPGAIVGVVGPNGAGKTTLLRMIVGQEKPDSGTLSLGATVSLAYVDQSRDSLDGSKAVWAEIGGGEEELKFGSRRVNTRAYCSWFGFRGADQQKLVSTLSGGERNRLHLAKLLRSGGNLLLLDEPTNDLDVNTLRALEEALLAFVGSAIIVTHDRWFLDRVATHILAFEGMSQVRLFAGNWQAYEEDRLKRLGEEGARPHRIRYKPISR
ncbi:MAG: energy-dependent translational throttle protein EttA [Planctomycetes bacterium]|jgi:ATP-binding cassette ChvD family protein|nr:energy-dependent translational throttle protein EttA [Planctomycetota bacterium]